MEVFSKEMRQWLGTQIATHKFCTPLLRNFVAQEIPKVYAIYDHTYNLTALTYAQVNSDGVLKSLKFGNVNSNMRFHGNCKSLYDYRINNPLDFVKLFLPDYLACNITAFDESMDLSAILHLLGMNNPCIFTSPDPTNSIQEAANDVRKEVWNKVTHFVDREWTEQCFNDCFKRLEVLIRSLGLNDGGKAVLDQLADYKREALEQYPSLLADEYLIALTMKFEEDHKECVLVLPYRNGNGQVEVHLYVHNGKSGVSEDLKVAAKEFFRYKEVNLRWLDLYNKGSRVLKVKQLEYPSGKPGRLERDDVEKINEIISKHLHVFSKYRNVTAVQPSLKVTESNQTTESCIAVYVLGKGHIPIGESAIPRIVGGYCVDVVDGFWYQTAGKPFEPWKPKDAQKSFIHLRLGTSIGVKGEQESGTLGAILEDENNRGMFYLLTCNHVLNGGEQPQIIHPGLNDYQNVALWNLRDYMQTLKTATPGPREGEIDGLLGNLGDLGDLDDFETLLRRKFDVVKEIEEQHVALIEDDTTNPDEISFKNEKSKQRFRRFFPDDHQMRRKRLSVLLKETLPMLSEYKKNILHCLENPPRDVATFTKGIRNNVKLHGKKYYVDAAVAVLSPDEVDALKHRGSIIVVGTFYYPSGNCTPATPDEIKHARELCKSGRTTGLTTTKYLRSWCDAPVFLRDNPKFRVQDDVLRDSMKPGRVQQTRVTAPGEPVCQRSEESEEKEASGPDEEWLHNCLCILSEKYPFSDDGDSGAVIFEKCCGYSRNLDCLSGIGVLFGSFDTAYKSYALASPLEIVLKKLSREVSDTCSLKLVSDFYDK